MKGSARINRGAQQDETNGSSIMKKESKKIEIKVSTELRLSVSGRTKYFKRQGIVDTKHSTHISVTSVSRRSVFTDKILGVAVSRVENGTGRACDVGTTKSGGSPIDVGGKQSVKALER